MTTAVAPDRRARPAVRTTSGHEAARRASRLVGGAALDTAAVPDAAVLLVRRLADPLPRRIASHDDASAASPGWERALRASIAECYRTAARPGRAPVSGDVNAVCFEDRAELLACLVRDVLAGAVRERWWWRAFLRTIGRDATDALSALWHEDATLVPAVLDQLARTGHALPLLSALSPAAAARALREVAMAFELPVLAAPVAVAGSEPSPKGLTHVSGAAASDLTAKGSPNTETGAVVAPWSRVAPDVPLPPAIPPECSALLGVSLVLAREPLLARSRDFARALHFWRVTIERRRAMVVTPNAEIAGRPASPVRRPTVQADLKSEHIVTDAPSRPIALAAPSAEEGSPVQAAERGTRDEAEVSRSSLTAERQASVRADDGRNARPEPVAPADAVRAVDAAALTEKSDGIPVVASPVTDAEPVLASPAELRAVTRESPPSVDEPSLTPLTTSAREQLAAGVATELGGALLLVNALRHLRFFDLLDEHFAIAASFGGWGWLELFARTLLGEDNAWAAADPLWRALAALDGRENGEPLVAELREAPEEYRLPSQWFAEAVAEEDVRLALRCHDGRLQLWHQSRFAVADWSPVGDMRRREAARDAARAHWPDLLQARPPLHTKAARRRVARRSACAPLGLHPGVRLRRFTEFVLPYLRWRLAVALGLPELDDASAARLLRRRAWLYVTRSHVDVRMPLETADVSTRRAGLDANPGWVSELGRIVTFFFDASGS